MRSKITGIYLILNKVNQKRYFGQSRDVVRRINNHTTALRHNSHTNEYLQNSWNKYGEENFELIIFEECKLEELNDKEKYYIKEFETFKFEFGYNKDKGGNGIAKEVGDYFAEMVSKANIERIKNGFINPMLGKHHTEEAKRKISEKAKGRVVSEETRKKTSESSKNRPPVSDETRKKLSVSNSGERNAMFNKHHSDESKKHLSEIEGGEGNPMFGKKLPNSTSLFFGVMMSKEERRKERKWITIFRVNGKNKYVGSYFSESDAAKAYDDYVIKNNLPNPLNFPNGNGIPYYEISESDSE